MSNPVDRKTQNLLDYNTNIKNVAIPPDLAALITQQTALAQQLVNLPSGHPTRTSVTAQKAVVDAAIAAHPRKVTATIND